jgi:hypothetical protein
MDEKLRDVSIKPNQSIITTIVYCITSHGIIQSWYN